LLTKEKMIALFLILFLAIPTRAGLADGGSRCIYRLDYVNLDTGRRAFSARAVFNATGYFSTAEAYRWFEDGEMGACAPPGAVDERGMESFSVDTGAVEYSLDSDAHGLTLHYAHFPIGIKYHELGPISAMFSRFFDYFAFETDDGEYYPCCPERPCRCVCRASEAEEIETFCVETIAPLNCTAGETPAPPEGLEGATLTMRPSGWVDVEGPNGDWFEAYGWVLANGTERHASVVRNEIIYRDQFDVPVNYTDAMCFDELGGGEGGCLYMRPGGRVSTELFMGPALGQAQRLTIEVDYWNLPVSEGGLCIYFDYDGLDTNSDFPAVPKLNRVWCGNVMPHDSYKQTIRIDLPLNYGPAHSGIEYTGSPTNGSSRSRPLVVEVRGQASIALFDVRVVARGAAYHCLERIWPARRDANEGAEPWWWQGVKLPERLSINEIMSE
jgi:hypothetical protein